MNFPRFINYKDTDYTETNNNNSFNKQSKYDSSNTNKMSASSSVVPLRKFDIIYAATRTGEIGLNGNLPWGNLLTTDLQRYKNITTETTDKTKLNAVIMGRRTWESIPDKYRPLKGRYNIILSNNKQFAEQIKQLNPKDTIVKSSLSEAMHMLSNDEILSNRIENIFIAGGSGLYAEALNSPLIDKIHLTQVLQTFTFDTKVPNINQDLFDLIEQSDVKFDNNIPFQFLTYKRKPINITNNTSNNNNNNDIKSQDEPHEEYQYLNLVRRVIDNGNQKGDRTGTGTVSLFGAQMRFSLRNGQFPLLTTKRVFWRGVLEELLWLVQGCTDTKELSSKKVHIWDDNASREFLDKLGFNNREVGDLGPVYGHQWRHFGAKYIDCHTNYNGQGVDQLAQVINTIKTNPNDRRIIMSAWNPIDIPEMALPPCHILAQFYVANGEVSCQMYQRSCDLGLGIPFNIASYSLLTVMIAHVCGLRPGDFIHVLGDAHVYNNHIEPLKQQLQREPRPFPTLLIKRSVADIDSFTAEDFELKNYQPHDTIKMQMAV